MPVEAKLSSGEFKSFCICLLHLSGVTAETQLLERKAVNVYSCELTSGTQKAPAHIDGGVEEAVPLGAAVAAADHDVVGEDDATRRHAAVSRVIGHWTADTAHQTTWTRRRAEGEKTQ